MKTGKFVYEIWRFYEVSRWRPSAVLYFEKYISKLRWSPEWPYVLLSNFVKIGQTITEISRFNGSSKWRPPPSWTVKMSRFLTVPASERPNLHHAVIFHKDRSIRCWDVVMFRFFEMAAVRHKKYFKKYYFLLCKISLETMRQFRKYEGSKIFVHRASKYLFTPQKWRFGDIFPPS